MNYQYYSPTKNLTIPSNKKTVLVGGCFDILHFGHIQFLEKAKQCGEYRITQHKNRIPTHTQTERASNLLALRSVDEVIMLPPLHGFQEYLELVQAIKPHVIAITNNDPLVSNKRKQAAAVGAQLIAVTDVIGSFSSSAIARIT